MRRKLLALIAVALLALAGLTTANAAGLNLQSADVSVASGQTCTTEDITVTGTQWIPWLYLGSVRLSGIPESCWNLPIRVTAGNGQAEGTSPGATSASIEIEMDRRYSIFTSTFYVVIDGWHVPVD